MKIYLADLFNGPRCVGSLLMKLKTLFKETWTAKLLSVKRCMKCMSTLSAHLAVSTESGWRAERSVGDINDCGGMQSSCRAASRSQRGTLSGFVFKWLSRMWLPCRSGSRRHRGGPVWIYMCVAGEGVPSHTHTSSDTTCHSDAWKKSSPKNENLVHSPPNCLFLLELHSQTALQHFPQCWGSTGFRKLGLHQKSCVEPIYVILVVF